MNRSEEIVAAMRCWVEQIVIGHNFCPFARQPFEAGEVRFAVSEAPDLENALQDLISEARRLDDNPDIETTLLSYSWAFQDFDEFLDLIEYANQLLSLQGYEGIYQLAHFHPDYLFEGSTEDDPANYTNRAPWPTLHLIREASLEKALSSITEPEAIPERNIRHATELGSDHFQALLAKCAKPESNSS